jgi:hypothetical protein
MLSLFAIHFKTVVVRQNSFAFSSQQDGIIQANVDASAATPRWILISLRDEARPFIGGATAFAG